MPRNGTPACDALDQRLAYTQRIQRAHHLAEMAHAGKQDLGRRQQARGIAHQGVLAAEFAERVLHAAQIARAVIEDGDHNSPLVDGSWSFRRASLEQANFMARAKHLKMASSL